jgi:pilus assembly protein CpaB
MGRRTLLLIASILVAALGTALIGVYVQKADARARRNQNQVTMLVAADEIAPGTAVSSISGRDLRTGRFLAGSAQRGYRSRADFLAAQKDRSVKLTILPGQQIVPEMFAASAAAVQNGLKLDRRGVAVELTDPARAAGLLVPGSEVTVYATPEGGTTRQVLKTAVVLRIGNQRDSTTGTTTPRGTARDDVPRTIVTLDLNSDQAFQVIKAQAEGELYFSVHGKGP